MRTGHKPQPPRCTLDRLLPKTPDVEKLKEEGWREHGILVVRIDDPRLDWIAKQIVQQIGDKLFGKARRHA